MEIQGAALLWWWLSGVNEIIGNIVLVFWLHSHGVHLQFWKTLNPGLVLNCYRDWCDQNKRPAKPVVIYSILSMVSVILSCSLAILITA